MMASAARDPYWRARVIAESAAAGPSSAASVEDKCLRCHAAADQYPVRDGSRHMRIADLTELGRDGVTCTVCHRIDARGLGEAASLTGGFHISGDPVLFGPHERPFRMPMLHHTGYEPVMSGHMLDAALCGSCHTLLVKQASGSGMFAEQATWLEWLVSGYPERKITCQSCHVPPVRAEGGSFAPEYIAQRPPGGPFPPTRPRTPVGLHTFVGGNVQMLETLADADPNGHYREQAEATRKFLRGALKIEARAAVSGASLAIDVHLRNLTGHKLPTGLPVRRLWLHTTVLDSANKVLFESGAWHESSGELRRAAAFEPHHRKITRQDQTMIYEAVMVNAAGETTDLFTQAVRYRKDNRLLPAGFARDGALPAGISGSWIQPAGTDGDPDFTPGADKVEYRIHVGDHRPPFRVSVEACYQSIRPADAKGVTRHVAPIVIAGADIDSVGPAREKSGPR
jgi:hypothetical protein